MTASAVLFFGSALPARAQTCVGDCNDDGQVAINELVIGINIALDLQPVSNCPSLGESEATPTPTGVATETPTRTATHLPTETATPGVTGTPDEEATATPVAEPTATATLADGTPVEATATPTSAPDGDTPTPEESTQTPEPEATATPTAPADTETPAPADTPTPEESATPGDGGGSGTGGAVTIGTLITAVNNALEGCPAPVPTGTLTLSPTVQATATQTSPASPTPEATATPEPTGTRTPQATATATSIPPDTATPLPTETGTPQPDLDGVAGATTAVLNGVNSIPNLISAIVAGVVGPGGQGSGAGVDRCELGGTVSDSGSLTGSNGLTITLANCEVSRPGGSILFNGIINVRITSLVGNTTANGTAAVQNLTVQFKTAGQTTLTTTANLTASIVLTLRLAGPTDECDFAVSIFRFVLTKAGLVLTGTLSSQTSDGTLVGMTFDETMASLTINTYGAGCVPTKYVLELDGGAQVEQSQGGGGAGGGGFNFSLNFVDFLIDADGNDIDISGKMTADCFGGTVTLSTPQSIQLLLGQFCPEAGRVRVQDLGDIIYSNGGVTVDSDAAEPMSYPSCLDPALLTCIG